MFANPYTPPPKKTCCLTTPPIPDSADDKGEFGGHGGVGEYGSADHPPPNSWGLTGHSQVILGAGNSGWGLAGPT